MSLFKAFGSIAKSVLRSGLVPGGGLIASAADSIKHTRTSVPGIYTHETTTVYDHSPVATPGAMRPATAAGGSCPIGFRLNKSTYVTRGGGTSKWPHSLQVHQKGSTCVKRRRRNVGNAKALRRAISRVRGFVHLAHRAMRLVGHKGSRRRGALPASVEVVRTG